MYNLISVIIVSYNASVTIEMAMLSVLNQKNENIELLIIDGKSTDNTIEIVKRYKVRVDAGEFSGKTLRFVSDTDDGIYDAMNKGINIALGNWLFFWEQMISYLQGFQMRAKKLRITIPYIIAILFLININLRMMVNLTGISWA